MKIGINYIQKLFFCLKIIYLLRKIDKQRPIENEGWITSPIVQRKSSKNTTYVNYGNATYFQSLF